MAAAVFLQTRVPARVAGLVAAVRPQCVLPLACKGLAVLLMRAPARVAGLALCVTRQSACLLA